ncbi:putative kinase [Smittium mucronatum]|uniref:Putative kinase n=1 Tax=Smittium mucronatum TaxID=133383 RepID=A0A1R0GSJ5_9FUNG|nr:putative kinase [Smittium mucronatum]
MSSWDSDIYPQQASSSSPVQSPPVLSNSDRHKPHVSFSKDSPKPPGPSSNNDQNNRVYCNQNIQNIVTDAVNSFHLHPNKSLDLAESTVSLREIAKKIVTKLGEDYLIGLTRDIVIYLTTTEFSGAKNRITVYVENPILNSKKFNLSRLYQRYRDIIGRIKEWTPAMCVTSPEVFDFVITLGGDGTLLYTSWLFQKVVPLAIPFNLGSLGFLTNFDIKNARQVLRAAINHGSYVNLRMRFKVTVFRAVKKPDIPKKNPSGPNDRHPSFKNITVFGGSKPGVLSKLISTNNSITKNAHPNLTRSKLNNSNNLSDSSQSTTLSISNATIPTHLLEKSNLSSPSPIDIASPSSSLLSSVPKPDNDFHLSSDEDSDVSKKLSGLTISQNPSKNDFQLSFPTIDTSSPLSSFPSSELHIPLKSTLNSTLSSTPRLRTMSGNLSNASIYSSNNNSSVSRSRSKSRRNHGSSLSAHTSLSRSNSRLSSSFASSINLDSDQKTPSDTYNSLYDWIESDSFNILNEVVVDRGPNPFLSVLELYADDVHLTTVQADGLVLSTPTGSTALSSLILILLNQLSAGGSLVHPSIPALLITPICPHTLSFRPMLLPDTVQLKVEVPFDSRNTAWVSFDGRNRLELNRGDYVKVSASNYPLPSMTRIDNDGAKGHDWFQNLTESFNWNTRMRQKQLNTLLDNPDLKPTPCNEDDLADDES